MRAPSNLGGFKEGLVIGMRISLEQQVRLTGLGGDLSRVQVLASRLGNVALATYDSSGGEYDMTLTPIGAYDVAQVAALAQKTYDEIFH